MTFLFDHDVPDELSYSLKTLGHGIVFLREILPVTASDQDVLRHAAGHGHVLITCNRDDFLALANSHPHRGLIILIRRKTRMAERVALVHLLDRAGEAGIVGNVNFA